MKFLISSGDNHATDDRRVIKHPQSQNNKLSDADRLVRKWNALNSADGKRNAEFYTIPTLDGKSDRAASFPLITGSSLTGYGYDQNDRNTALAVLSIYRKTRTIILDAFIAGNILHEPNGDYTAVNLDLAYHRDSPTNPLLKDNKDDYYTNHADSLHEDLYHQYLENDNVNEFNLEIEDEHHKAERKAAEERAQVHADDEVSRIEKKDQETIDTTQKNRTGDILDLFIEYYYLEMGERTQPGHLILFDDIEAHFPATLKTIKILLYIERHLSAENIHNTYITTDMVNKIYTHYYQSKAIITHESLDKLLVPPLQPSPLTDFFAQVGNKRHFDHISNDLKSCSSKRTLK